MKKFVFLIIAVAILGLIFRGEDAYRTLTTAEDFADAGERSRAAAVKVITTPVEMSSNSRVFKAVGTGRARYSVGIFPSVSEEVSEVLFEAEQKIDKGDVLVKLDDRQEQLALKLAEVQLNDAKSLLERYEQAVKEGAVPESEVDAARADFEGAQVALDQAKLAMEDRQITAPFDGYVGIPNIDPGDRVGADTLITWLDARETLYVDFEVPESFAGALRQAQTEKQEVTATTPAYLSLKFKGHITAQQSRVDPERRTLLARASLDNKDDLLRPGMSFETVWEIPGEDYPTVPEISLQWERGGSYVWLIRDGRAEKVTVQVVARKAGQVLLQGEIKDREAVVIEGLQRLRPGQDVEVLGSSEQ